MIEIPFLELNSDDNKTSGLLFAYFSKRFWMRVQGEVFRAPNSSTMICLLPLEKHYGGLRQMSTFKSRYSHLRLSARSEAWNILEHHSHPKPLLMLVRHRIWPSAARGSQHSHLERRSRQQPLLKTPIVPYHIQKYDMEIECE